jgi:TonB family protein
VKTSSFLIGTGKGISLILALLLLANCGNYQDRARTPLKPMVSVMHGKSNAFDVPPKVLKGYRPRYPQPEADNREKGFVSVICTIGVDGKATEFEIEQMTDPAFAYEAVRAIAKWKWAPAMKNGHPVTAQVRVPMHFNVF